MIVPVVVVGGSQQGKSLAFQVQRTINLYPEVAEDPNAKSPAALMWTPGLAEYVDATGGPVRGMRVVAGRLFAVVDNRLVEITGAGAYTALATLGTSTGRVGMTDNGTQLVIGDGTFYVYDLSSGTLTPSSDAPQGSRCAYTSGYVLMVQEGTGKVWWSDLNDASSVDGLSFVTAEYAPDNAVDILVDHNEIWIFGERTTELWQVTGGNNVISRVGGGIIEHGCASAFATTKLDNTVFWLGQDENGAGMVWRAAGYTPQRVSSFALEEALRQESDLSAVTGYTYQQGGHSFHVLNLPNGTSWALDVATGQWCERAYNNSGTLERHRADCMVYWNGLHLVGDYETGKVYRLDPTVYDDDGTAIIRRRVTAHSHSNNVPITYHSLEIDFEVGVGLETGQGSDPVAMLRYSDDGGRTWSSELTASMGAIGEYQTRAVWWGLGQARNRVFEISCSDPVKVVITAARADVTVDRY